LHNKGPIVIEKEKDRSIGSPFNSALQAFFRKAVCGGIDDPPALLSTGMPHITPFPASTTEAPRLLSTRQRQPKEDCVLS
jgi:hypothetical protein